ncbi:hypothetical protein AAC387_Pa06g1952 [Persea americana]
MVNDKPILPQVHDLQTIVNEIVKEGTRIDEQFQVATVIEKSPSTWKDIQKILQHKRKDYSLEPLQRYLRIEEEARISNKKDLAENGGKINLVESKPQVDNEKKGKYDQPLGRNKKSNPSFKRKNPNQNHNRRFNKNQGTVKPQAKGSCFICGKSEHFARECCHRKKCPQQSQTTKPQANVIEEEQFIVIISELNAVSTGKSKGWWIDSGATTHITFDSGVFKTYEKVTNDCKLALGTTVTTQVIGRGKVELQFTFGKTVTLLNVFHAPELRKNLVSGYLLNKAGFKQLMNGMVD